MSTSIFRGLAISGISLVALSGCSNKRQQAQIDKLQGQLDETKQEIQSTVDEMDKEIAAKEEAMRKLETETSEQIQQLTAERDKLRDDYEKARNEAARAEADRLASLPKDASTPGHADFDPAKETKFTHTLATIVGDVSTSSGFVVEASGKRYLYAPVGSLTSNSRLAITSSAGDKLTKFGDLEVAEGCPFVRLELLEADAIPALQIAASSIEVGNSTKIACLGINPSSAAVTGALTNAFGQNADSIDMDPNLLVNRIGGPVVETATGKVLGIILPPAVERSALWEDRPTTEAQLRVARLNRELAWQPVPVATFLAEAKRVADFDRLTKVAQALAAVSLTPERLVMDAAVNGTESAKSILTEAKDFPPAAEAVLLDGQLLAKKVRPSGAELKKRLMSMFVSAGGHLKRNSEGFEPAKFSPFHRKPVENSIRWRKEAVEHLVTASQTVSDLNLTPPSDNSSKRDRNQDKIR